MIKTIECNHKFNKFYGSESKLYEKKPWKVPIDKRNIKSLRKISDDLLGSDNLIKEMWYSTEQILLCEASNNAKNRASVLGFENRKQYFERIERSHHLLSENHLKKMLNEFKRIRKEKKTDFEKYKLDKEKLRAFKIETLNILKTELLEKNLKPDEVLEIVQIYEEILDKTEESGINGLMDIVEEKMDELISVRSNVEKNRGRDERHSPLPWWKWLLIFSTCGVSVYVGWWCVVIYACLYYLEIIIGTGSIVELIVNWGC